MDTDSQNVLNPKSSEWRTVYEWDGGWLDPLERTVELLGEPVLLTRQEFDSLELLVRNSPNSVDDRAIYACIWGSTIVESPSVAKLMSRLRRKTRRGNRLYVSPKDAAGYRFLHSVALGSRPLLKPVRRSLDGVISVSATEIHIGGSIVFTCEPNGGTPPYNVVWNGFTQAVGASYRHIFSAHGTYALAAEIRDEAGSLKTCEPVVVHVSPPPAENPKTFPLNSNFDRLPSYLPPRRIQSNQKMLTRILIWMVGFAMALGVLAFASPNWILQIVAPIQPKRVVKSPTDEAEIRSVVRDSQIFETLVAFENPKQFDRSRLKTLWVPAEKGGKAILAVESATQRQIQRGIHYGTESKAEIFDIIQVTILQPGDYAEVKTKERWYLPVYREDGARVADKNPFFGPYQIDYTLRKIEGKWLLQFNGTPYAQ